MTSEWKETEVGRIPVEWEVMQISKIGDVIGGGTPKTSVDDYWGDEISWITPKDLSDYTERYIYNGSRSITKKGLDNSSAKILPKGTVLFSSRAPIGYLAIAGKDLCTNQGFKNIVCDQKRVNNFFLYYLMIIKRHELENIAGGSTFKEVSGKTVKEFRIPIPPLKEQKAIAHILSTIDEKIETNNQINKKLEEMAQIIFKHWFVDFEFPNEDGEPYKSSGGEMIESELGMIPKGWEVKEIKDIASMKNGVNYGREQEGNLIKVVNVRDFDGSLIVNKSKLDSIRLNEKQINNYLLKEYDTVIVRSAKPGETLLVFSNNESVYSGFTIRVRSDDKLLSIFIFYSLRNSMRILNNSSEGTIFKNLNQQILGSFKVTVPEPKTIKRFNSLGNTLLESINNKIIENNYLIQLRDTLLPKLMSGQIRVPLGDEENYN